MQKQKKGGDSPSTDRTPSGELRRQRVPRLGGAALHLPACTWSFHKIFFKITLIQSKKHSGFPSPAQGSFGYQRKPFFIF